LQQLRPLKGRSILHRIEEEEEEKKTGNYFRIKIYKKKDTQQCAKI